MSGALAIRVADSTDAPAIAVLNGELGYPSTPGEVEERLGEIFGSPGDAVLVAERQGRVVGWAHVALKPSLLSDRTAQLMGLVVAENERSAGIGRALVTEAEGWAQRQGIERMVVTSRVSRERAHRFYEREGYTLVKRSLVFEKQLRGEP
jgi:GNAT superfamily N-acetyltransferase